VVRDAILHTFTEYRTVLVTLGPADVFLKHLADLISFMVSVCLQVPDLPFGILPTTHTADTGIDYGLSHCFVFLITLRIYEKFSYYTINQRIKYTAVQCGIFTWWVI
jgi:hypothetical protein